MSLLFQYNRLGAERSFTQTSLRLAADALSCALPRVPHFGEIMVYCGFGNVACKCCRCSGKMREALPLRAIKATTSTPAPQCQPLVQMLDRQRVQQAPADAAKKLVDVATCDYLRNWWMKQLVITDHEVTEGQQEVTEGTDPHVAFPESYHSLIPLVKFSEIQRDNLSHVQATISHLSHSVQANHAMF